MRGHAWTLYDLCWLVHIGSESRVEAPRRFRADVTSSSDHCSAALGVALLVGAIRWV